MRMKKIILFSIVLTFVSAVVCGGIRTSEPTVKVKQSGNFIKVTCENAAVGCPVKISILNEYGKPIFSETLKAKNSFTRLYNFSKLADGTYWVTVISDTSETIEKIKFRAP
jgi:hypothetical protein